MNLGMPLDDLRMSRGLSFIGYLYWYHYPRADLRMNQGMPLREHIEGSIR